MPKKKNVVTIGGGTGTSVVLSGLRKYPVKLSAIVTMMDSGGSTGQLVRDFNVHPMGDVRQALLALSRAEKERRDFFEFRFDQANLLGHNAGNLFLAGYEKQLGSFEQAIKKAYEYLEVEGEVIPVTLTRTELVAQLAGGRKIFQEHSFDDLVKKKNTFQKLLLSKRASANPRAISAIKKADAIIICPGNPLRSVLPNFLVGGIRQAFKNSKAPVIFCANLLNKKGQTDSMDLAEVVDFFEKYIGKGVIDYVIYNSEKISGKMLKKSKLDDEVIMPINEKKLNSADYQAVSALLLATEVYQQKKSDVLLKRTGIRHDPKKLATIIMQIIQKASK
ncbi:MAG: gluconeogenesis factor YvcK family protein [Patescibacteria group bacterium]